MVGSGLIGTRSEIWLWIHIGLDRADPSDPLHTSDGNDGRSLQRRTGRTTAVAERKQKKRTMKITNGSKHRNKRMGHWTVVGEDDDDHKWDPEPES
jgi:hypothetical protein